MGKHDMTKILEDYPYVKHVLHDIISLAGITGGVASRFVSLESTCIGLVQSGISRHRHV